MRLFFLTVAGLLFSASCAKPEINNETPNINENPTSNIYDINELRPDYDFGICRSLTGNVSVVVFYIDDFESSWSENDTLNFTNSEIKPALEFLEAQAELRGIDLKLTVKNTYMSIYYNDAVITDPDGTGLVSADILWESAVALGYESDVQMIEKFKSEYGTETVYYAVFNKCGTAYALNPKRDSGLDNINEHCIVFAKDLNYNAKSEQGSQASVVAHEMLHLFGAEDYYDSVGRKSLANKYYPLDIMLSTKYNINQNNIGDATAFYIGWTDSVPDIILNTAW